MTRVEFLKAMHSIIASVNDENAYMRWVCTVPDEPNEDDFEFIAGDDESFDEAVELFISLMQKYGDSGIVIDGELYG